MAVCVETSQHGGKIDCMVMHKPRIKNILPFSHAMTPRELRGCSMACNTVIYWSCMVSMTHHVLKCIDIDNAAVSFLQHHFQIVGAVPAADFMLAQQRNIEPSGCTLLLTGHWVPVPCSWP